MFWKRRKETGPLPRTFRSARWRSMMVVLLCAGGGVYFSGMLPISDTPKATAEMVYRAFMVGACAIAGVAFFPSIIFPTRVTMDSEGFAVRSFWRGEKRYRWKDISHFLLSGYRHPYIAWVDKARTHRLSHYDHRLRSGMWQYRNKDLLEILSGWLDEYNKRRARRR